jgi:ribosome-associated heat shock protein Hsp15
LRQKHAADTLFPRFDLMQTSESVRIDKWLWAVRLFKSRSLAAAACNAGHVKIGGTAVKPSRDARVNERIDVFAGQIHRTVKVLALLDQRVGAKRVSQFLEDLTPPEEYARAREDARLRIRTGLGRPTKKQRRQLERFL